MILSRILRALGCHILRRGGRLLLAGDGYFVYRDWNILVDSCTSYSLASTCIRETPPPLQGPQSDVGGQKEWVTLSNIQAKAGQSHSGEGRRQKAEGKGRMAG